MADNSEVITVVSALRLLGYSNAYGIPVAPWICEEPIAVASEEFKRESRQVDGSVRGVRSLVVHVCRLDGGEAETAARKVAAGLSGVDWAAISAKPLRVVACDVGQPVAGGHDASGHWIWDVPLTLTVVIEHE